MTKKFDIMDSIEPGKWAIVGDKVQKIQEAIPTALVVEKEEKKKVEELLEEPLTKASDPVIVMEPLNIELEEKPKKPKKKKWGKK